MGVLASRVIRRMCVRHERTDVNVRVYPTYVLDPTFRNPNRRMRCTDCACVDFLRVGGVVAGIGVVVYRCDKNVLRG